MGFETLEAAPLIQGGFPATMLTLQLDGASTVRLRAVERSAAMSFASAIEAEWRKFNLTRLTSEETRISSLMSVVAELHAPKRYQGQVLGLCIRIKPCWTAWCRGGRSCRKPLGSCSRTG